MIVLLVVRSIGSMSMFIRKEHWNHQICNLLLEKGKDLKAKWSEIVIVIRNQDREFYVPSQIHSID